MTSRNEVSTIGKDRDDPIILSDESSDNDNDHDNDDDIILMEPIEKLRVIILIDDDTDDSIKG